MNKPEHNKEVVIRFNKEFIEQDNVEVVYEIIDPEFINHSTLIETGKGPDGVIYFYDNFLRKAFHDIKVEIYDQIAEGDKVVIQKVIHATHKGDLLEMPATNKEVSIDIIEVVRLKNGKFIEQWTLMDFDKVLAQISEEEKVF